MARKSKKTPKRMPIRRLRHWKQRYNKNAEFIFRRPLKYGGWDYEPGDPIPKDLKEKPTKLRRFWESKHIELAEFEAPNVVTGSKPAKATKDNSKKTKPAEGDDWLN